MGETHREWLLVREAGGVDAMVALAPSLLRIGRGPSNQLVLADSYASADHAELVSQHGQRCVRDLGSTNGTRLNGRPISPRTLHALRDGDVIRIGDSELTYRLQAAPERSRPGPTPSMNGSAAHVDDGTRVLGLPSPSAA